VAQPGGLALGFAVSLHLVFTNPPRLKWLGQIMKASVVVVKACFI